MDDVSEHRQGDGFHGTDGGLREPAVALTAQPTATPPQASPPALTAPPPTRETYAELQQAYDHFNATLFDGKLPLCLITLQRKKRTFGYFSRSRFVRRSGERTDEIALNPGYFGIRPIPESLSTLVHEMVHLKQAHFGKPPRGRYHNAEWAAMMQEVGLMPSNTGKQGGRMVGDHVTHYIVQGGKFEAACSELLTKAFTLSWLDRFPPCEPGPSTPTPEPAAAGGAMQGGPKLGGGQTAQPSGSPMTPPDQTSVSAAAKLLVFPDPKKSNASNRVKYRCANCLTQVWGKPGLKIRCGEEACENHLFEPAGAST